LIKQGILDSERVYFVPPGSLVPTHLTSCIPFNQNKRKRKKIYRQKFNIADSSSSSSSNTDSDDPYDSSETDDDVVEFDLESKLSKRGSENISEKSVLSSSDSS